MQQEKIYTNEAINSLIDVIAYISDDTNKDKLIVLFDRDDHTPLQAINYLASACKACDKFNIKMIDDNIHVW